MKLLPVALLRPVAVAVPLLEAVVAIVLVAPETPVVGCGLAVVLLTGFTAAISAVLRRGTAASCRCFGVSEAALGMGHVVRNVVLAGAAAAGAAITATDASVWRTAPAVAVLAAGTAVLGAVVVVMLDEIVGLLGAAAPGARSN